MCNNHVKYQIKILIIRQDNRFWKQGISTPIFIPESVKKPLWFSGISKITKSVLAISGMKIGEKFSG